MTAISLLQIAYINTQKCHIWRLHALYEVVIFLQHICGNVNLSLKHYSFVINGTGKKVLAMGVHADVNCIAECRVLIQISTVGRHTLNERYICKNIGLYMQFGVVPQLYIM